MAQSMKDDFFSSATVQICGTLDIEKALCHFVRFAKAYLPVDQITLNTFDSDKGIIRVLAVATAEEGRRVDIVTPLMPQTVNDLKSSRLPKVRVVNNPDQDRVTAEMTKTLGEPDSSFLIMRLELDHRRLGTVVVRCAGRNSYSDQHKDLMASLNEPFAIALSNFLRYEEVSKLKDLLADDNRFLHQEMRQIAGETVVGKNHGLRHVMELIGQVAHLASPVLLLGETGTGKEVLANAIHDASKRRKGPLVKVNCAAIPESLMDSELFGHEKGAFTGAVAQKRGRFERAHNGTLFLDEIGELKPDAQAKLLRVLQHHEVERVGGTQSIDVDTRIIAATHRNLEKMVLDGSFREDLWYRLNVFPIVIPPLRARKDDIALLVAYFVRKKTLELGIPKIPSMDKRTEIQLSNYHWPGNVRELENLIERALIRHRSGPLMIEPLGGVSASPAAMPVHAKQSIVSFDEAVHNHIAAALELTNGRIEGDKGAAKVLDLNPSTLRNKMRKLGIQVARTKT